MAWHVQVLEVRGSNGVGTGRFRLTATSDEDGGGPYGDTTIDHATPEEAYECERSRAFIRQVTGMPHLFADEQQQRPASPFFYGTKFIKAQPMRRDAYNEYRGWDLPADEDPTDDGYLVEYLDGGTPNHPDHEGYISWSPKAQFENAYQSTDAMNFGHALQALKDGHRVARAGWNGKGMWLALSCAHTRDVSADDFWSPHNAKHAEQNGGTATVLPSITMKTADGSILMGWLASQTDMLADDWCIVEPHP